MQFEENKIQMEEELDEATGLLETHTETIN